MSVLICGSMAYDTIMVFQSQFKRHILPEQIHILNVCFLVPELRREFGGCAGNIAYSLKLLGGEPRIMATVGEDAGPYFSRLDELGIDASFVREVAGCFTAQAFITTDLDDNQITAFHPGAMNMAHINHIDSAVSGVQVGIVAPDGHAAMVQHIKGFAAAGIPFVFDPGQQLPQFSRADLLHFLDLASWCTVNDYEARLISEATGLSDAQIAERLDAYIVTLGAEGSRVYADGKVIDIPAVEAKEIVDPTGCGDAYRGGLLFGLAQAWDIVKSAKLASLMGSFKIAHRGGQNHAPSLTEIRTRFEAAFGETF